MRAVARLGRIAAAFSSHARANARTMPALALAPPRAAVAVAPRGVAASTRCATTMTCSAARRHLPSPSRRAFASRATASASAEAAAETAAEAPAKTERRKRVLSGETASHTTPFAWCTPFLEDFSRRHSSPALPFQRLTGKTFD